MYKGKLPHYHPIIIACFVKGKWLSRSVWRWLIDSCVQYPGPLSGGGPHLASWSWPFYYTLQAMCTSPCPFWRHEVKRIHYWRSLGTAEEVIVLLPLLPGKHRKKKSPCCHNWNLIQFTNLKWHLSLPYLSCPCHSPGNRQTELYTNLPWINISSFTFFFFPQINHSKCGTLLTSSEI